MKLNEKISAAIKLKFWVLANHWAGSSLLRGGFQGEKSNRLSEGSSKSFTAKRKREHGSQWLGDRMGARKLVFSFTLPPSITPLQSVALLRKARGRLCVCRDVYHALQISLSPRFNFLTRFTLFSRSSLSLGNNKAINTATSCALLTLSLVVRFSLGSCSWRSSRRSSRAYFSEQRLVIESSAWPFALFLCQRSHECRMAVQ